MFWAISTPVIYKAEIQLLAATPEGTPTSNTRQREVLRLLNRTDPTIIEPLLRFLEDPDPLVRYAAAWALNPAHMNVMGLDYKSDVSQINPSGLPRMEGALLSALADKNHWIKIESINALVELAIYRYENQLDLNKNVIQALVRRAKDPDPEIRFAAIKGLTLWKKNSGTRDVLKSALEDKDRYVRKESVAFGVYDLPVISGMLADNDYEVRVKALYVLAYDYPKDPRTMEHLIQALHDPHNMVIYEAIHLLGELRNPKAVKPLLDFHTRMVNKPDVKLAVEKITGKPLDEVLKTYTPDETAKKWLSYRVQLLDMAKQINTLQNGTLEEEVIAIHNISFFFHNGLEGQDDADTIFTGLKAILTGLKDENPRIRYASIKALSWYYGYGLHSDLIFRELIKNLDDPDFFVRRLAVETFSNFNIEESDRPHFIKIVSNIIEKNDDPFVRRNAISILPIFKYTVPGEKQLFLRFIKDEFYAIRRGALWGIIVRCEPEMIPVVIEALSDPVVDIRYLAIGRLQGVGPIDKKSYQKITTALKEISEKDPSKKIRDRAKQSLRSVKFQQTLEKPKGECEQINGDSPTEQKNGS